MEYTGPIRPRDPISLITDTMDNKETFKGRTTTDILLYNEEYFKYIFKKTEKIVAAVFYTTRSISDISTSDTVVVLLEDKARALLETCEKTLRAPESARKLRLEELRIALIGMESALVVGNGARIIPFELLEVFRHELSSVHRSLKDYAKEPSAHPLESTYESDDRDRARRIPRVSQSRPASLTGVSSDTTRSVTPSRRDRILAIIKDKGQASIKDVSSVIAECSEKTIQRELMSLISEGLIVKQGERRWSKYSMAV
jgi:hypothetical protein